MLQSRLQEIQKLIAPRPEARPRHQGVTLVELICVLKIGAYLTAYLGGRIGGETLLMEIVVRALKTEILLFTEFVGEFKSPDKVLEGGILGPQKAGEGL